MPPRISPLSMGQTKIKLDLWRTVSHLAIDLQLTREATVDLLLREALAARQIPIPESNGVHP